MGVHNVDGRVPDGSQIQSTDCRRHHKKHTLGQIKWQQIVFLGNPEYGCELHNPNFAKYADACGGLGWTVEFFAAS